MNYLSESRDLEVVNYCNGQSFNLTRADVNRVFPNVLSTPVGANNHYLLSLDYGLY